MQLASDAGTRSFTLNTVPPKCNFTLASKDIASGVVISPAKHLCFKQSKIACLSYTQHKESYSLQGSEWE